MNHYANHYRLNCEQRDRVIRAANQQRLIKVALERAPKTRRQYAAALLTLWQSLIR